MSPSMSLRPALRQGSLLRRQLLHTTPTLDPVPGPPPPATPTHRDIRQSSASAAGPSRQTLSMGVDGDASSSLPIDSSSASTFPAGSSKSDAWKSPVVPHKVPRTLPSHLPPLTPSSASSSSSSSSPSSLPNTVPSALSLLKSQSNPSNGIYILARLHARTYLLHPRDILTLPTLKPLKPPGTTMSLTRILEVGSRDYAIRSPAADAKLLRKAMNYDTRSLETIPDSVAKCQVTVLEHTRGTMMKRLKFKRRGGARKTVKGKPGWTRLRVGDIILGDAA